MKSLVALVLVALQFSVVQSNAQAKIDENTSICVIKNFVSKTNSGRRNLTKIEDDQMGPFYNQQELTFEDFKVTFFNGTRLLELTKAGLNVASVRVGAIKSGDPITLSVYDSQSGNPSAEVSCRIVF